MSVGKKTVEKAFENYYYQYALGFIGALIITYVAYFGAINQWFGSLLPGVLLALATAQFFIQMVVFLHLGKEDKPRYTLISVVYVFLMMLIIVVVSLWIMKNMNYNMHAAPEQMYEYMLEQNKKGF